MPSYTNKTKETYIFRVFSQIYHEKKKNVFYYHTQIIWMTNNVYKAIYNKSNVVNLNDKKIPFLTIS